MIIQYKKKSRQFERNASYDFSYGSENHTFLDKLCALLIALAPILQFYVGLYENAGITVLIITVPIIAIRLMVRLKYSSINKKCLVAILPLLFFEVYTIVDRSFSTNRLLYGIFMIGLFFSISCGCVNIGYIIKYATAIAKIASILLFVQYVTYYIFHIVTNLEMTNWLLDQNSRWATAILSNGAMYRPSAFFLEPPHMFLYCFPTLCLCLLLPEITKSRKKEAILISVSICLSTSGMGIVTVICLWLIYFLLYHDKDECARRNIIKKLLSPRTMLIYMSMFIILVIAYYAIPVFQNSVNRIFWETNGSTAIDGRVRLAQNYVSNISGKAVFFGTANIISDIEFNLSGFFATYIKWGFIGLFFTYWFYGQGLLKLKRAYFWISCIILLISYFTAHTHGTFYMLYYTLFLMNGYYYGQQQESDLHKKVRN